MRVRLGYTSLPCAPTRFSVSSFPTTSCNTLVFFRRQFKNQLSESFLNGKEKLYIIFMDRKWNFIYENHLRLLMKKNVLCRTSHRWSVYHANAYRVFFFFFWLIGSKFKHKHQRQRFVSTELAKETEPTKTISMNLSVLHIPLTCNPNDIYFFVLHIACVS